jgi:hypothetical protein
MSINILISSYLFPYIQMITIMKPKDWHTHWKGWNEVMICYPTHGPTEKSLDKEILKIVRILPFIFAWSGCYQEPNMHPSGCKVTTAPINGPLQHWRKMNFSFHIQTVISTVDLSIIMSFFLFNGHFVIQENTYKTERTSNSYS